MRPGPLFREAIEIHIREGHGFAAYFYLLLLFVPVVVLSLFLPTLDAQVWIAPAAFFNVSAVAAMLLIGYFTLRMANQEFAPWRFVSLRRRLVDEKMTPLEIAADQLALLALEIVVFILLAAPLLLWAGAIARVPGATMVAVVSLLFFYALCYGVWGLAALAAWERKLEMRQVFIRAFFISALIATAVFYLPLNPPAFLLAYLSDREMAPLILWGRRWPAGAVHFLFHAFLLGAGAALYLRALRREIDS